MPSRAIHQMTTRAKTVDRSARRARGNALPGGTERPGIPEAPTEEPAEEPKRTSEGPIRLPRQRMGELSPTIACRRTLLQMVDTRNGIKALPPHWWGCARPPDQPLRIEKCGVARA